MMAMVTILRDREYVFEKKKGFGDCDGGFECFEGFWWREEEERWASGGRESFVWWAKGVFHLVAR